MFVNFASAWLVQCFFSYPCYFKCKAFLHNFLSNNISHHPFLQSQEIAFLPSAGQFWGDVPGEKEILKDFFGRLA